MGLCDKFIKKEMINGLTEDIKITGWERQTVIDQLAVGRAYEAQTAKYFAEHVSSFDGEFTFLDIGAYIGYYSLICANLRKWS